MNNQMFVPFNGNWAAGMSGQQGSPHHYVTEGTRRALHDWDAVKGLLSQGAMALQFSRHRWNNWDEPGKDMVLSLASERFRQVKGSLYVEYIVDLRRPDVVLLGDPTEFANDPMTSLFQMQLGERRMVGISAAWVPHVRGSQAPVTSRPVPVASPVSQIAPPVMGQPTHMPSQAPGYMFSRLPARVPGQTTAQSFAAQPFAQPPAHTPAQMYGTPGRQPDSRHMSQRHHAGPYISRPAAPPRQVNVAPQAQRTVESLGDDMSDTSQYDNGDGRDVGPPAG
ncbi:hypothetical protein AAE478_008896 [Parahypoxylon ruwenzoriense]